MSLIRAIQSAIFHYASCGPCLALKLRRRRAAEAKAFRKARSARAATDPAFYERPGPGETNIYWRSEIEAGPGLAPRVVVLKRGTGGSEGSASAAGKGPKARELVRRDSALTPGSREGKGGVDVKWWPEPAPAPAMPRRSTK